MDYCGLSKLLSFATYYSVYFCCLETGEMQLSRFALF